MDKLKIGSNSFIVNLRRSGDKFTLIIDDDECDIYNEDSEFFIGHGSK